MRLETSAPTQYLAMAPIAPPIAIYKYFSNAPPFRLFDVIPYEFSWRSNESESQGRAELFQVFRRGPFHPASD
jgi:hypothetical protein